MTMREWIAEPHFGLCYHCRAHDHRRCIGVPCQCPCPLQDTTNQEIRAAALAKLTPAEREALGL